MMTADQESRGPIVPARRRGHVTEIKRRLYDEGLSRGSAAALARTAVREHEAPAVIRQGHARRSC